MFDLIPSGVDFPESIFGMAVTLFIFLVGTFFCILTMLMPYFVWKISSSISRCEKLMKDIAKQSDLLTSIEGEISTNIAPANSKIEGYIRADMEQKYDMVSEESPIG